MEARTPNEILTYVSDIGVVKTQRTISSVLILSFFAGTKPHCPSIPRLYLGYCATGWSALLCGLLMLRAM